MKNFYVKLKDYGCKIGLKYECILIKMELNKESQGQLLHNC